MARNRTGIKQYDIHHSEYRRIGLIITNIEIPTSSTRDELRQFARGEFERQKDVTDIVSVASNFYMY
jgi:hypothetical protein